VAAPALLGRGTSIALDGGMLSRLFLVALLGSALLACKREHPATSTTTTSSADVEKLTASAVDRIASARCRREVACEHVGPGRRHASVETCEALTRSESHAVLGLAACPNGVDQAKVVDCVAAIETASCLDPVDAIVRVEACRQDRLCLSGSGL
jgi:hypothetical protein